MNAFQPRPRAPRLPPGVDAESLQREVAALSNDDLDDALTSLCAHQWAAEYRLLCLIREWDERVFGRGTMSCGGVKSTAHWLNFKCGIALGAAREKVRVARALAELPKTSARFEHGEISYSKVRAITRVATAENEDALLHVADHGTATHVERLTRAYRHMQDADDPERLLRQRQSRSLSWYWDDDGMLVVQGRLMPEDGALFIKAVEAGRERMWQEERAERERAPAEAEVRTKTEAATVAEAEAEAAPHESESRVRENPEPDAWALHSATRVDALLRLLDAGSRNPDDVVIGPDRYHVVIRVVAENAERAERADEVDETGTRTDAAFLRKRLSDAPTMEPGTVISAALARRLACDASVTLETTDADGQTLSIGRRSRAVPAGMRRALMQRDGGCAFPGCTQTHHVDAHHMVHWADGGETSLDNLVLLCRYHHRLVHEEGHTCEPGAPDAHAGAGRVRFRDRNGNLVPETFPRKRGSLAEMMAANRRRGLEITALTCNGGWDGGRMDHNASLDVLWDCDHPRPAT